VRSVSSALLAGNWGFNPVNAAAALALTALFGKTALAADRANYFNGPFVVVKK